MTARSKESKLRDRQNAVPPTTSPTPQRNDATILADRISKTLGEIRWPRMPEMKEFEATGERMLVAGYFSAGEMVDTSSYEGAQLYGVLSGEKPIWA